jgi:hypothetical protein
MRRALAASAAILALSTMAESKAAGDDDDCGLRGPFSSDLVPPPVCTSPVGLCTTGQLSGNFPAKYEFRFSTLQSTADPSDPTAFVYTGHSVVTTSRGVLYTEDSGLLHMPPDGSPGQFVTTASITSGSGRYRKATGVFVATGELDFVSGHATGSFILSFSHESHSH